MVAIVLEPLSIDPLDIDIQHGLLRSHQGIGTPSLTFRPLRIICGYAHLDIGSLRLYGSVVYPIDEVIAAFKNACRIDGAMREAAFNGIFIGFAGEAGHLHILKSMIGEAGLKYLGAITLQGVLIFLQGSP